MKKKKSIVIRRRMEWVKEKIVEVMVVRKKKMKRKEK
jgi:hypothetical protein